MRVHPYAEKFPLLPEAELVELAESIRANGLRQPIVVTTTGEVLDGRNRAAACERVGVEPTTVVYDGGDLAEFVIDANAARRHMTTGARAMATALVLAEAGRRKDGRWEYGEVRESGRSSESREAWAKALRTAGLVLDYTPELVEHVVAGDLALDAAYGTAKERRDAKKAEEEEAERLAVEEEKARVFITAKAPDLAAEVGGERVFETFVEALAVWEKRNREEVARVKAEKEKQERHERHELDNSRQHCQAVARALSTLESFTYPEARERSITEHWRRGADGASPAMREHLKPDRMRGIADALRTYADEWETANA